MKKNIIKVSVLTILSFVCVQNTFANGYKGETTSMPAITMPNLTYSYVPSWYVGGNIGVSHVHDKKARGSADSVTEIGPGWSVDLGYQFLQVCKALFAGELGYTQYYHSSETLPRVNVATTEHFSSYLAAVGQYPLGYNFNVLGKLGIAYSYAKKVFTVSGASGSANAYSPYYALGFSYNVTSKAALVAQWARARGNGSTGSNDLSSLGVSYSFG